MDHARHTPREYIMKPMVLHSNWHLTPGQTTDDSIPTGAAFQLASDTWQGRTMKSLK